MERVAADPLINCICMDLAESYARYAVRYWLTDLTTDDPTDSAVRCRIFMALKRAGIPLSIPAQALFTTRDDSAERRGEKNKQDIVKRQKALAGVDLFNHMTDEERAKLAVALIYSPFTKGEAITKQGATAHWLYIIISGNVSIRVTGENGLEREVTQLADGHFFGEMSLMTGENRAATVVALTDVECYRLDKEAFKSIISMRPELAKEIASILAERRAGLDAIKEGLSEEAKHQRIENAKVHLLDKIEHFFGLNEA
jgi:CRP-like cAMP-binding protein